MRLIALGSVPSNVRLRRFLAESPERGSRLMPAIADAKNRDTLAVLPLGADLTRSRMRVAIGEILLTGRLPVAWLPP
jgi:hypothetical protein